MAINKYDLHLVGGNLRALFVPSVPGWSLLSADYSQVLLCACVFVCPGVGQEGVSQGRRADWDTMCL
eukprot:scaffold239418_cov17-Tisochrysis_lutea.AAC.1